MNKKVILIQNWFNSDKRHDEYIECLKNNDNNKYIDNILLLCNDKHSDLNTLSSKVKITKVQRQPTYMEYFKVANKKYPNCICILSNLDIYYDESLKEIHNFVNDKTAVALSRYDVDHNGNIEPLMVNAFASQDSWIFETPLHVSNMNCDFTLGVGGCDNRIAYELGKNNKLINPCKTIKSFHLHTSEIRTWENKDILQHCDGFKNVYPENSQYISYSMFTPANNQQNHRDWDKFYNIERYWYNIPAIIAVYKTLHPEFIIKLHISSDIRRHPMFKLLEELEKRKLIELRSHYETYKLMEPTLWRYESIFDNNINSVFVRDLDSLPTSLEISSNINFLKGYNTISTIRSHPQHNIAETTMLAGLSSFKPMYIGHPTNYEGFYDRYNCPDWGMDQRAIIDYTFNRLNLHPMNFIDFRISKDNRVFPRGGVNYISIVPNSLDVEDNKLYIENIKLFKTLDNITSWSGQPTDVRKEKLDIILANTHNIGKTVRKIIIDLNLEPFYGISK